MMIFVKRLGFLKDFLVSSPFFQEENNG
jgi:hypothetical protein